MPIFEYECPMCGTQFEVIVILAEDEAGRCPNPECHYGGPCKHLISVPAIAKLAGGFCARRWNGKDGAATSRGPNDP